MPGTPKRWGTTAVHPIDATRRAKSATFGLMPGTLLRYKYTIGVPTDEGRWSGTEEFPLTERGFDVTKDPACKKMKVRDIFADRPSPTGTLGPGSVMNDCVP